MATKQGEQGTGRHPHKDSQEPYSHTKEASGENRGGERSGQEESTGRPQAGGSSDDQSLKEREYKDAQGNVHHHTKSYMEQHQKD